MNLYHLFVDELGLSSLKSRESDVYVLTGIAVKKEHRDNLKNLADQIKFKYWGRTNIIFHSRDIGKNLNEYKKFKNNKPLQEAFNKDLFQYLSSSSISIFSIVVDKQTALKRNWNEIKIIKETVRLLYFNYLAFLLGKTNSKGKIIVESATSEKDIYYLKYFAYYISPTSKEFEIDYRKLQDILTSISFVTKRNFDIEEQLADLFSYAGKCKYLNEVRKIKYDSNCYESKIIDILNNKLFVKPKNSSKRKLKFYEKVQPFVILPKK